MRIVYFDCIGGASGDMLLSALLDAGATEAVLQNVVTALHLEGCTVRVEKVMQSVLSAQQVSVIPPRHETERHATELMEIIDQADLSESVKHRSHAIILRLAQVEAKIHNSSVENIHLHEVGGDDTLIDIVGVLSALEELQIERVYCSPLPLARGFINSMHGMLPLPAPATLALLSDAYVRYVDTVEAELVTPTGAALITSLADEYGGFPPMQLKTIGIGAGHRQMPFPNIIRAWIGETQSQNSNLRVEKLTSLETNAGDVNLYVHEHEHKHMHEHEHVMHHH